LFFENLSENGIMTQTEFKIIDFKEDWYGKNVGSNF
jgi:hypothetical protein